ncbi:MAG: diacylglycerol kinase family protein [Gluconacetobacter diazotrophicus]|nr:diacylglycerol kinase family protein [Gluconacetobacter diazotrophicus]
MSPEEREPFSWRARANSFVYAFRGVWWLLRREHNAWIHLGFAAAACAAGWWWRIGRLEWALVVFAIGSVLAAEAVNTAVETLADALKPERHPLVGRAKDLAAAGVLLAAIGAALVGVLVFGPRVWALLPLR